LPLKRVNGYNIVVYFQNCQMNHSVIHAVISLDARYDGNKTATQAANLTNVTLTQDDTEDGGSPQSGTQYYGTLLTYHKADKISQ
jgi:hypothetical protein